MRPNFLNNFLSHPPSPANFTNVFYYCNMVHIWFLSPYDYIICYWLQQRKILYNINNYIHECRYIINELYSILVGFYKSNQLLNRIFFECLHLAKTFLCWLNKFVADILKLKWNEGKISPNNSGLHERCLCIYMLYTDKVGNRSFQRIFDYSV